MASHRDNREIYLSGELLHSDRIFAGRIPSVVDVIIIFLIIILYVYCCDYFFVGTASHGVKGVYNFKEINRFFLSVRAPPRHLRDRRGQQEKSNPRGERE